MAVQRQLHTAAQFDHLLSLPENRERRLELVGGEVIEVVSNNYASLIALYIAARLLTFVEADRLGWVTGADGGYRVAGERYIPDAAYISRTRQPEPCREAYNPLAPDLALEVVSPTDEERTLRIKLTNYLAAGTTVWVVYPQEQEIEIHAPGQPVRILDRTGTLDGGAVLPGFSLAIQTIFDR